jgi:ArsR family transcriptional regulator
MLARAADLIKCLGHPLRLRLVEGLEAGERTVTDLQTYAGAPQAQVSQQLAALKARGIVSCRRAGTFVYYRIREPRVSAILTCLRACDRS